MDTSERQLIGKVILKPMGEISYSTLQLVFTADRRVVLDPLLRGDVLRGSFGITLRKLVCHDLDLNCRNCLLRMNCPYPALFEPRALVEEPGWKDPPPPFVFRPELSEAGIEAGAELNVELTLIGRAIERLPYVIVALRGMPTQPGLAGGALRLSRVIDLQASPAADLWSTKSLTVLATAPSTRWTPGTLTISAPSRIRVVFESPTEIVHDGRPVARPDLQHIVRRLADRAESLAWAHCGGSLEFDRAGLAERCKASIVASDLKWASAQRRSSRTGQTQQLSGLVGWIDYEGDFAECWSLLKLGEVIHVGKDAAFGKGRLRIISI